MTAVSSPWQRLDPTRGPRTDRGHLSAPEAKRDGDRTLRVTVASLILDNSAWRQSKGPGCSCQPGERRTEKRDGSGEKSGKPLPQRAIPPHFATVRFRGCRRPVKRDTTSLVYVLADGSPRFAAQAHGIRHLWTRASRWAAPRRSRVRYSRPVSTGRPLAQVDRQRGESRYARCWVNFACWWAWSARRGGLARRGGGRCRLRVERV